MINQYRAQRFKIDSQGRKIGTVPIGTIVYLQDRIERYAHPECRNPWIVLAWCGQHGYMHLAIVQSLRDGRKMHASDHLILASVDAGLEKIGGVA